MGYIEVTDNLKTEPALRYVEACKNGQFVMPVPEAGCSLNIEMTSISDTVYHRTCNFLDRMENKPYYTHRAYPQVIAIRKENRSRLEFIMPKATTPFSNMSNIILIEMLHLTLASEVEALHILKTIDNDFGATAVQQNLMQHQVQAPMHTHVPDQFKHQFQNPMQEQYQNPIQEQYPEMFQEQFQETFQFQAPQAPVHDQFTIYLTPPPGIPQYRNI